MKKVATEQQAPPPPWRNVKIEKGIPVPAQSSKFQNYPFAEMEVNDSFMVAGHTSKTFQGMRKSAISRFPTKHFISRTVVGPDGQPAVRVWRTE